MMIVKMMMAHSNIRKHTLCSYIPPPCPPCPPQILGKLNDRFVAYVPSDLGDDRKFDDDNGYPHPEHRHALVQIGGDENLEEILVEQVCVCVFLGGRG